MNNAEYFLKDEVMKNEFIEAFKEKFANNDFSKNTITLGLSIFFEEPRKPVKSTLTKDERVILRNIDMNAYQKITRDETFALILFGEDEEEQIFRCDFDCYNHLFTFIKERRRILNRGVVEQ